MPCSRMRSSLVVTSSWPCFSSAEAARRRVTAAPSSGSFSRTALRVGEFRQCSVTGAHERSEGVVHDRTALLLAFVAQVLTGGEPCDSVGDLHGGVLGALLVLLGLFACLLLRGFRILQRLHRCTDEEVHDPGGDETAEGSSEEAAGAAGGLVVVR